MEAPSPCTPRPSGTIAGHPATLLDVDLGTRRVRLHAVRELETLVDGGALLRGEAEPPYWAHLWPGARVLASYLARFVPLAGRRVLEIGAGLGLPGITAATLGARVTLVDAAPEALAFAAASAAANHVHCTTVPGDFMQLDPGWRFDVVLAAEVAYDRERWPELAAVCERHLLPDGVTYLADGYRTDTRGLYAALAARGLVVHAVDVRIVDDGRPAPLRVAEIRPPAVRRRDSRRPPL